MLDEDGMQAVYVGGIGRSWQELSATFCDTSAMKGPLGHLKDLLGGGVKRQRSAGQSRDVQFLVGWVGAGDTTFFAGLFADKKGTRTAAGWRWILGFWGGHATASGRCG